MKTFYSLILLLLTISVHAQVVNINPDPNGDPWIAGDGLPMTPEMEANTPIMTLSPLSSATALPSVVKNNELIYMPPSSIRDRLALAFRSLKCGIALLMKLTD